MTTVKTFPRGAQELVLPALLGAPFLLIFWIVLQELASADAATAATASAAALGIAGLWVYGRTGFEVGPDGLTVVGALGRQEIPWAEIGQVALKRPRYSRLGPMASTVGLELRAGPAARRITIPRGHRGGVTLIAEVRAAAAEPMAAARWDRLLAGETLRFGATRPARWRRRELWGAVSAILFGVGVAASLGEWVAGAGFLGVIVILALRAASRRQRQRTGTQRPSAGELEVSSAGVVADGGARIPWTAIGRPIRYGSLESDTLQFSAPVGDAEPIVVGPDLENLDAVVRLLDWGRQTWGSPASSD